jgi:hypothetical protein
MWLCGEGKYAWYTNTVVYAAVAAAVVVVVVARTVLHVPVDS